MIQHINANLAQCQNNGLRGKQAIISRNHRFNDHSNVSAVFNYNHGFGSR